MEKNSWRNYPISQQPAYDDVSHLNKVEKQIEKLPPLVFTDEVRKLKNKLAKVSQGEKHFYCRVAIAQKVFLILMQIY